MEDIFNKNFSWDSDEEKKKKCHICDKEFDECDMEIHLVTCEKKKNTVMSYLKNRIGNFQKETTNTKIKCDICHKVFSSQPNLKTHRHNIHKIGELYVGNNRTRTVRLCGPHPHSSLKIVRTRTVTRTLTRPLFLKKNRFILSILWENFLFSF